MKQPIYLTYCLGEEKKGWPASSIVPRMSNNNLQVTSCHSSEIASKGPLGSSDLYCCNRLYIVLITVFLTIFLSDWRLLCQRIGLCLYVIIQPSHFLCSFLRYQISNLFSDNINCISYIYIYQSSINQLNKHNFVKLWKLHPTQNLFKTVQYVFVLLQTFSDRCQSKDKNTFMSIW